MLNVKTKGYQFNTNTGSASNPPKTIICDDHLLSSSHVPDAWTPHPGRPDVRDGPGRPDTSRVPPPFAAPKAGAERRESCPKGGPQDETPQALHCNGRPGTGPSGLESRVYRVYDCP